MKKIAIIGTVGLPAKYGGFETLTEYLVRHLSDRYDLTVYCSAKSYEKKPVSYNGATLKYINLNANGVQSIPYDILSILKSLRDYDTLLILGVSGCSILPLLRIFTNKRIVVNIDGLEWKRQKWNRYAKWFLKFSEKMAVKYADAVIADNKVIQEYLLHAYGKKSELIAYGADHVERIAPDSETKRLYPFLSDPYAFTVCRIEPENNLHLILEAMVEQTKLPLVIVGNWERSEYGEKLRKKYKTFAHIHLLDPIYDQHRLNQLRSNCTVYLHGHSAGGTNPSLVEAMYLGLPIFAYDVDYNKETTQHSAAYFHTANDLRELVEQTDDKTLKKMGKAMHEIAKRNYVWRKIADAYAALF